MRLYQFLVAACFGWAVFAFTSCNFTPEEKQQMIKSKNGKDYFRDSEKWGKVVTQALDLGPFAHIVMDDNADKARTSTWKLSATRKPSVHTTSQWRKRRRRVTTPCMSSPILLTAASCQASSSKSPFLTSAA